MKVLQVNCVYKKGSTGKIMYDIHNALVKNNIESVICYGRGARINEPNVYKTSTELYSKFNNLLSRITGLPYGGCFFSTLRLKSIIKKEKPDVVHLHCINGFFVNIYEIINWLKKNHYNTVLTLHAEFMYTANCGSYVDCQKWKTGCGNCPKLKESTNSVLLDRTAESFKKMKKAFAGFNDNLTVVSVSPWLKGEAESSVILGDKKNIVIVNGINTDEIFYLRECDDLKLKYAPNGEKIILHVTSGFINPVKGGNYVIELAKRFKNENFKIILIGNDEKKIDLPSNIINIGKITDQNELARYYSMADVTLLTSLSEACSTVCEESLACGTPVMGFKAGGPETISLKEYCMLVDPGDINSLENAIREYLHGSAMFSKTGISNIAVKKYSRDNMSQEYINEYYQFK